MTFLMIIFTLLTLCEWTIDAFVHYNLKISTLFFFSVLLITGIAIMISPARGKSYCPLMEMSTVVLQAF